MAPAPKEMPPAPGSQVPAPKESKAAPGPIEKKSTAQEIPKEKDSYNEDAQPRFPYDVIPQGQDELDSDYDSGVESDVGPFDKLIAQAKAGKVVDKKEEKIDGKKEKPKENDENGEEKVLKEKTDCKGETTIMIPALATPLVTLYLCCGHNNNSE